MEEKIFNPNKGEKARVSSIPFINGYEGSIVQFKCWMMNGGIIDFEGNRWDYVMPYKEDQKSNWTWDEWCQYNNKEKTLNNFGDYQKWNIQQKASAILSDLDEYIPEVEQQQIKEKLIPELNKQPLIGQEYEFYDDDGRFPENLIYIGRSGDLYIGTYKDIYAEGTARYLSTVSLWKFIRPVKKKEPIHVSINEIKKKFGYDDDQPVFIDVSDTVQANKGITPVQLDYLSSMGKDPIDILSEYEPYKQKPSGIKMNFSLGDDGFTDKTDIFDNKEMD